MNFRPLSSETRLATGSFTNPIPNGGQQCDRTSVNQVQLGHERRFLPYLVQSVDNDRQLSLSLSWRES